MVNVYLFIELLRAANAADTVAKLESAGPGRLQVRQRRRPGRRQARRPARLQDERRGNTAILEKISPVEGIVQTNIIAAVRPVHK